VTDVPSTVFRRNGYQSSAPTTVKGSKIDLNP